MFFSASKRWADRILIELSKPNPYRDEHDFIVEAQKGIDIATDLLYMVTTSMMWRAIHMKTHLSDWPNGHLWEQSREQVNHVGEGARRVVPRETVLAKALALSMEPDSGEYPAPQSTSNLTADSSKGQLLLRLRRHFSLCLIPPPRPNVSKIFLLTSAILSIGSNTHVRKFLPRCVVS